MPYEASLGDLRLDPVDAFLGASGKLGATEAKRAKESLLLSEDASRVFDRVGRYGKATTKIKQLEADLAAQVAETANYTQRWRQARWDAHDDKEAHRQEKMRRESVMAVDAQDAANRGSATSAHEVRENDVAE